MHLKITGTREQIFRIRIIKRLKQNIVANGSTIEVSKDENHYCQA